MVHWLFIFIFIFIVHIALCQEQVQELALVHVKVSYDNGNLQQPYTEYKDTWMSPSVMVLPNKLAGLDSVLPVETALALRNHESNLIMLRDKLWLALFSKPEPSPKTITSILQILDGMNIPVEHRKAVAQFMLPSVYIFHEADYKKRPKLHSMVVSADSFDSDSVLKYLQAIKDHRSGLLGLLANEFRVKSPFGLGDDIQLAIVDYHGLRESQVNQKFTSSLQLTTRKEVMAAERELSALLRQDCNEEKNMTMPMARVKVLQFKPKHGRLLQTKPSFTIPWEKGGCSTYPSLSQLRAELVDRVVNADHKYAPITDPIFQQKHLFDHNPDGDRVKCKRACVDHLDSGLGFEVAVACRQNGCLPLAMTISDKAMHRFMDVPLRQLPDFMFAAVLTSVKLRVVVGVAKILAEIAVFSHTSSLPFIKKMLKVAANGQWFPPHLTQYRADVDCSVFERVLVLVEKYDDNGTGDVDNHYIRPNWDRHLMALL